MTPDLRQGGHPIELNELHRRHLAVSIRHIAGLLDNAERLIGSLAPPQRAAIADSLDGVRKILAGISDRFGIHAAVRAVDALHNLKVQTTMAGIATDEMRPRSLRGYGPLDSETTKAIEAACDELQDALRRVRELVEHV